ncbi:MAG TPA: hypothetical protein VH186_05035 [Chloroflexia bacterium]|nr:hypothetical protein [Chloroflexia bacterium]
MRNRLELALKIVTGIVVVLLIPPAIICFYPAYRMWLRSYYSTSTAQQTKKLFYLTLLTALIPGLFAFLGFQTMYFSFIQKMVAVSGLSLPYFIGDGDSFEYFVDFNQAVIFTLLLLVTLLPTYAIMLYSSRVLSMHA